MKSYFRWAHSLQLNIKLFKTLSLLLLCECLHFYTDHCIYLFVKLHVSETQNMKYNYIKCFEQHNLLLKNHRIIRVGKDLWRSTPLPQEGHLEKVTHNLCRWVLNVSRGETLHNLTVKPVPEPSTM